MNRSWRFSATLTLAFLAGAGLVAWHHELWRDEMQAWLIARDSPNLWTLCLQGRYDGTPPLWYLWLRPLTLFTHRPEAMQVLTWGLAGFTFFLVCHFSPFSRFQKVLLLFNYYLLFEYGTVCRQYLPGILFLFSAGILFPAAGRRPWPFTAALAAAALASVYSLILAVALAAAFWGMEAGRRLAGPGRDKSSILAPSGSNLAAGAGRSPVQSASGFLLPLLALTGGIAFAAYSMLPAADALYAPAAGWRFGWDAGRMLRVACAFANAHFLLPRPEGYFWIPAWLTEFSWPQYLAAGLSLPLAAGAVILLRRSAQAVCFYLVGALGISLFLYAKYLGFTRHAGFLFVAWLLACWLKKSREAAPAAGWGEIAFTLILATQAVTSIWAAGLDLARPFSNGAAAADALVARHLDQAFIAAWPDTAGAVLAGYLNRSIYYPQSGRWGSFTRWDTRRDERMTDAEAWRLAEGMAGKAAAIIVTDHELAPEFMQTRGIAPLGLFRGSLVPFEDYFVYLRAASGPLSARLTGGEAPAQIPRRRPAL